MEIFIDNFDYYIFLNLTQSQTTPERRLLQLVTTKRRYLTQFTPLQRLTTEFKYVFDIKLNSKSVCSNLLPLKDFLKCI